MTANDSTDSKFLRLLESAPDAIVIADTDGRIALVNAQAERLFGYARSEMIGQPIELLVPDRYRRNHARERQGYAANAHPRPMGIGLELYGRRRDGSEFPVEISLSPLESESGQMVISAIRDITARKQAEAERDRLIKERAAHAEASRVKDEFLATLSHELRTPLNAILGWTSLLLKEPVFEGRTRHALETILRNARAQTQLVEDLLDLSRVVTGKLRIASRPVDLVSVLDAALDVVRPAAEAKRITIEIVRENADFVTLGDEERLRQAIWNVLSNAVKFTAEGGRIRARLRRDPRAIRLEITDTGIGIAADFLPHVFDRFRQADSSTTRTHGGLGLGLSIVRSIIEAHGGTAAVNSDGPGKGTTLSLELPAAVELIAEARRLETPAEPPPRRLDGLRVLVVDDAPDERELFCEILSAHGAIVETAASVEAALAVAQRFSPHVVVSDLAMPIEDGYVFLRRLRELRDERLTRVPTIALTAHARAEDRDRALAAGFDQYVSKPVFPERLVGAVATAGNR
jgi:PAS domain S-box-containing protein